VQVETKAINKEAQQKKTNVNVDLKDAVFIFRDSNRKITAQKKYNELTEKERNNIPPPPPPAQSRKASNPKIVKIEMTSDGPKINSKDARNQVNSNRNITPPPPPPATSKIKSKDQNAVYKTAEISTKPDYPGGMQAFYKFIALNYTAPEKDGLNGKVYVTFIVEKDGSLSDIKVLRDIGYGTGEEATRVLKLSQNWIPGMINDDAVRVSYSLPIKVQTAG
jgi:protein TonB